VSITDKYIEQLSTNSLNIDLIDATFVRQDQVIKGMGFIYQNSNGEIFIKVFNQIKSKDSFECLSEDLFNQEKELGAILGADKYYSFSGLTIKQQSLHCNRVRIEDSINFEVFIFKIHSDLIESNTSENYADFHYVQTLIGADLKIPTNGVETVRKNHPDNTYSFKTKNNLWYFTSDDNINFKFIKERNYIRLTIASSNIPVNKGFVLNCIHTLSFILGKNMNYKLISIFDKKGNIVNYYSWQKDKVYDNTVLHPPLVINYDKPAYHSQLFELYLNYIQSGKGERLLHSQKAVASSSYSYLSVFSLTLATSIEKICNFYFHSSIKQKLDVKIDEEISIVKGSIISLNLSDSLRNRIKGFLGTIKKGIRTKDILYDLEGQGLISEGLAKGWSNLRDPLAHGNQRSGSIQERFDLVNSNLLLYYQLIFLVIRYKGKYSDYSKHGYPVEEFTTNS